MRIADLLKRKGHEVETVEASSTLEGAIRRFGDVKVRSLVVVEGEQVVGVLTMRDALSRIARGSSDSLTRSVREAMKAPVVVASPGDELEDVARLFIEHRINHVPIVSDGKLVGIATLADVLGVQLAESQRLGDELVRYICGPHVL